MLENQEQDELNPINLNIPEQKPDKPLTRFKAFWAVVLILLALVIIALLLRSEVYKSLSKTGQQQVFTIQKGERFVYISRHLYNRGLISNTLLFDLYGYLSGQARQVEPGDYALSPTMSMHDILHTLSANTKAEQTVVRIREGWTIEDMASYLDQNGIVAKQDFLNEAQAEAIAFDYFGETPRNKSLEGYLFPDTYFFGKDVSSKQIIERMLQEMKSKITPQMLQDMQAKSLSVYDTLTMASIIEKEVGRNTSTISEQDLATLGQERMNVASVFYNRLRSGMPLQSDATVTYITKKKNPSASAADIQIDSHYNTYKYPGLPLGPISSPSLSSIEAAIYPAQTNYMYFLTKPDGTAVFAQTLDQQNANKAKYLK